MTPVNWLINSEPGEFRFPFTGSNRTACSTTERSRTLPACMYSKTLCFACNSVM